MIIFGFSDNGIDFKLSLHIFIFFPESDNLKRTVIDAKPLIGLRDYDLILRRIDIDFRISRCSFRALL